MARRQREREREGGVGGGIRADYKYIQQRMLKHARHMYYSDIHLSLKIVLLIIFFSRWSCFVRPLDLVRRRKV